MKTHQFPNFQFSVFIFFLCGLFILSCSPKPYNLQKRFADTPTPPAPNYANTENWSALPNKKDAADLLPLGSNLKDEQVNAPIDVFFLHPTIFTREPENEFLWNASMTDTKLNVQVDSSTIANQATAFNGVGRVYAPRYRQSHYYAFRTPHQEDKTKALDIAYQDVKTAFEFYMKNWNAGRPIIIASHSQGTLHAARLIKEFFDGKPLQKQLVEAYLIGIALPPSIFEHIQPSKSAGDFGGWVSWNTFAKDYIPDYYANGLNTAVCTNPLSWKLDDEYASEKLNLGAIGFKLKYHREAVDAQCHRGLLWVNKPYIKGRALLRAKIWHKADINFFWGNIRQNAIERSNNFLKNRQVE